MGKPERAVTGLDRLLSEDALLGRLRRRKVGVLAHAASVTSQHVHVVDALVALEVPPVLLFGPEHGLRGAAQDMVGVDSAVDPLTGIPVVSLYGHALETLTPRAADLQDLDVLVIDLQDVGARYYTYVYTAWLAAREALRHGVEVVVLDRPNPIGRSIEGQPLPEAWTSFVGLLPGLPPRHGLTLAEVIAWGLGDPNVDGFSVIRGVEREGAIAPPWVMPSPNMPTVDTALVYPGMCLLEGTNLSEGRGTTRPFELFGAPWLDAVGLCNALRPLDLPGVRFRPTLIHPMFQKHARVDCGALQLHVIDADAFLPLRTGTAILACVAQLHPETFGWRQEPYEFVSDRLAIDLLAGGPELRRSIDEGAAIDTSLSWSATCSETRARLVDWVHRCASMGTFG